MHFPMTFHDFFILSFCRSAYNTIFIFWRKKMPRKGRPKGRRCRGSFMREGRRPDSGRRRAARTKGRVEFQASHACDDPARAQVMLTPPVAVQGIEVDAGVDGGVDELTVLQIHAHMGKLAAVIDEEDQIAGPQIFETHRDAHHVLVVRDAGQRDACLAEDIIDEARAVEAVRGGTAVNVGDAYMLKRHSGDAPDYGVVAAVCLGDGAAQQSLIDDGTHQPVRVHPVGYLKSAHSGRRPRPKGAVRDHVVAEAGQGRLDFRDVVSLIPDLERSRMGGGRSSRKEQGGKSGTK